MPLGGILAISRREVTTNTKTSGTNLDETLVEDSSDPDQPEEEQEYSVEAVVARRGYGSEREYNVKWKGYPSDQNTWYVHARDP